MNDIDKLFKNNFKKSNSVLNTTLQKSNGIGGDLHTPPLISFKTNIDNKLFKNNNNKIFKNDNNKIFKSGNNKIFKSDNNKLFKTTNKKTSHWSDIIGMKKNVLFREPRYDDMSDH